MTDPEALYTQLTSGDPGSVRHLGQDLQRHAHDIDGAAERLTSGLSRPVWVNSLSRLAFLMQGQSAFLMAATASWKLTRGSEAMALAADSYDATADAADPVIAVWRNRPTALAPFQEELLRFVVVTHLGLLAAQYDAALGQAAALLADADEDLEDWFSNGALRDYWFAIRTGAGRGPKLPDSLLNGDQGGWTLQGLAYDQASGTYLVSAYGEGEGGDDASHLTVLDSTTGTELTNVQLTSPSGSHAVPAPQHSGGVAVDGDDVYVVSTQGSQSTLYHYSLSEIRDAGAGASVPALTVSPVPASSYVSTANGNLYLGQYSEHGSGALYSYPLSQVPALEAGQATSPTSYTTPPGANGVVVLPDGSGFVYSQNSGRGEESQLITTDLQGNTTSQLALGNMAEEIELVDGQVVGVSESGSTLYSPWDDGTKDPSDLWGQTNMFELPLGLVTGQGYAVQPHTLREAAGEFDAAVHQLRTLGARIGSVQLVARWLGEVDGAAALASATDGYLDQVASGVRKGVDAADAAADGLRSSAQGYDDADGAAADSLSTLGSALDPF
jgi:hypothetical protein